VENANVDAPVLPHVSVENAVNLTDLVVRLEKLASDLDETLSVRKPIKPRKTAASQYIAKSPRLRARFN